MRYQDLKIRDSGRLALIGLAMSALSGLYLVGHRLFDAVTGRSLIGYAVGLVVSSLLCWGVAGWYLITTPAQNARYLEGQRQNQRLNKFDWTLLDRYDPDYQITTLAYLIRKLRKP